MRFSPSPAAVREQLERLIYSDQFGRSKRLRRFLTFTIEKTLEKREEELTEHGIGTAVYDRGAAFDPAMDGIVRTEAHRMRSKLEAYYRHEGRQDPVIIEFPIGSYIPLFQFSRADFLPKTGKIADLIRSIDWSNTALGPLLLWPRNLKSAVGICLRSECPLVLFWGPDFVTFANDAAYALVESTHPHITGRPASEGAVDWGRLSAILSTVMESGESLLMKDALWLMDRISFREELYFTTAFSAVTESDGSIAGVLAVLQDTTRAVIDKRRLKTLTELTERSGALLDVTHACRFAVSIFEHNPYDIPFACIYLYDDNRHDAIFRASAGVDPGTAVSPPVIADVPHILSPIAEASLLGTRQLLKVEGHLGVLPTGAWEIPPQEIAILPLPERSPASPAGFIIVGANPHRVFDRDYREFLETLAMRLSELIFQAQNVEQQERQAREAAEQQRLTNLFMSSAGDAMRTSLTILLGLLDEVLQSTSLLREQRRKLIMARRNALRISNGSGEVLDYIAGRSTRPADAALPAYGEEVLHWTDDQTAGTDDSAWQERKLVSDTRRRIVVIAEEEDFRRYLYELLSDVYSVAAVTDVTAAMTLLPDRPDLLILDDQGNGGMVPLIQSLRSDPALSLIPIILLSGQGSDEHRFQALASGVDDYLLKSFTPAELMARVRSQIALAAARAATVGRQIESQLPLSAALDQIPLGIMIAAVPSGAITFTNEAMGHMLGDMVHRIVKVEDIPEGFASFPDGKLYTLDQCPLMRAVKQGEVVTGEIMHFRLADGRSFDVRASSRPVRDINGNFVAAVLVLEKITQVKKLARRLGA